MDSGDFIPYNKRMAKKVVKRDENGRWLPGTSGGPGRPRMAEGTEKDYLRALTSAVSEQDVIEIAEKAVDLAKLGEPHARNWLSKYLLVPAEDQSGGKTILEMILDPEYRAWRKARMNGNS